MQTFFTNPVVGLVVCLVLGALALSGKLSIPLANALLLFAWGVGTYEIFNTGFKDLRLNIASTLVLGAACLVLSYWISPTTLMSVTEPPTFTIHDLFRADFSSGGSFKVIEGFMQDFTKGKANLGNHYFEVGLYGDFNAKSLFMSLYVPGDKDAHDIISWFADGYKVYLADMRKNIHVWTAPQGDQSQPLSDTLLFTKSVYVYYENILPDNEIDALKSIYRDKGLEPNFRGFGYLQYRRIQAKADPATAPKPVDASQIVKAPPITLPPVDMSPLSAKPESKVPKE